SWRALLVAATGHGRTMSFVVHLLGQEHDAEVDAFFKDLELIAPGGAPAATVTPSSPAPEATLATASAGGVESGAMIYTPPRGWTRTPRADAVAYVSPPYPNTREVCELVVLPM